MPTVLFLGDGLRAGEVETLMIARLSSPFEDMKDHDDVVVVGSGYGGAIAASRLARAGRQVCLLERGKELPPGEYPDTGPEVLDEMQRADQLSDRVGLRMTETRAPRSDQVGKGSKSWLHLSI